MQNGTDLPDERGEACLLGDRAPLYDRQGGRDPDRRDLHHEGKRYDCLVILVWVSVSNIVMSLMSVLSRTSSREHIFCLLHRSKSEQIPP